MRLEVVERHKRPGRANRYLSKPIIAVDGEGVTRADGTHDYIELAASGSPALVCHDGHLATVEILDYLCDACSSKAINVIYGGSYDFNHWLRDIPMDIVDTIYHSEGEYVSWCGYELSWMPGRKMCIRRDGETITIYDTISFFQCPFIKACDDYLGEYDGRDILVREKARRSEFTVSDLPTTIKYNNLELELLVQLITELRRRLDRVGLRISRWDSPGAIASAILKREKIQNYMATNTPQPVKIATQYAYSGGRFEVVRHGADISDCYEYDINSAYPSALTNVPNLRGGMWKHYDGDCGQKDFALYKVEAVTHRRDIPAVVVHRSRNGAISYPTHATNWIWSPEMELLREYPYTTYKVLESWEFIPANDYKPFHFLNKLYYERQQLKKAGDGAQMVLKLGINSMYGKTAQQVGWRYDKRGELKIPPFHQLEWAGYTTSHCRAKVLRAAMQDLDNVIAFETDAVIMRHKLDLPVSSNLGDWEQIHFDKLTYAQSGIYSAICGNDVINKSRGIDRGTFGYSDLSRAVLADVDHRFIETTLTRHIGFAIAYKTKAHWCAWETLPKKITTSPRGKRAATHFEQLTSGVLYDTICPIHGGESYRYRLEWLDGINESHEWRNAIDWQQKGME